MNRRRPIHSRNSKETARCGMETMLRGDEGGANIRKQTPGRKLEGKIHVRDDGGLSQRHNSEIVKSPKLLPFICSML